MGLAETLITTGAGLLSNFFSNNSSKSAYDRDIFNSYQMNWLNQQYNTSERLAAQEYNTRERLETQEYNSPANQLELAKQANINPNSIVGGNPFVSSSAQSSSAQSSSGSPFSSGLASALLTSNAQVQNLMANTRLQNAEADNKEVQTAWDRASFDDRLNMVSSQGDEILSRIEGIKIDNDIKQKTYEWFASKSSVELKQMEEQLNKLRNEAILSGELVETENLKQEQLGAQTDNIKANTRKTIADTAFVKQQTSNAVTQGDILESQASQERVKVAFSDITGVPYGTSEFEVQYALWAEGKWSRLASLNAETSKGLYEKIGTITHSALNNLKGLLGFHNPTFHFYTK